MRNITYILTSTIFFLVGCQTTPELSVEKNGSIISISGTVPKNIKEVEIQFHSDRNIDISSYLQLSPENPEKERLSKAYSKLNWDIYYPVVDIALQQSMSANVHFETPIDSAYTINGMFHKQLFKLKDGSAIIPEDYLQQWENNFYINSDKVKLSSFYVSDVASVQERVDLEYDLLSTDWQGDIIIINSKSHLEIMRYRVGKEETNPFQGSLSGFAVDDLSRNRMLISLAATVEFTLGCQDTSPNGKTKNGLNLFYDLDAKTYRRPTWVWGMGPSIKLLLESCNYPELAEKFSTDMLITKAKEIGEVALPLQIKDPDSPAHGVVISRWSENKGTLTDNYGFEEYYSVADAQFFVGWGWIPLYKETNDSRFLEGARLMTSATDRLTNEFDLTPMDYMVRAGKWKNYALNEQGFGTEGINELFKVDPNSEYQRIGHEYMQMLLKKFDTKSGIWNRMYRIEQQKAEPTRYHTRGVGWAMEGLIAAYDLTKNKEYLAKAIKMSDHLIENQLADGSWSYDFKSQNQNEISEKGTALWSLLFYKLYGFTKDPKHLEAARNALLWCLNNQYDGVDPHAFGGLVGVSRQSGVIYRHWYPMACTYTSGFFGLAVIEELKIQENES